MSKPKESVRQNTESSVLSERDMTLAQSLAASFQLLVTSSPGWMLLLEDRPQETVAAIVMEACRIMAQWQADAVQAMYVNNKRTRPGRQQPGGPAGGVQ